MGARLPLTTYLQAFTIHDALGDKLTYPQFIFALGVSPAAKKSLTARLKLANTGIRFTVIDPEKALEIRNSSSAREIPIESNFLAFCEMKSILIDEHLFFKFLEQVINIPFPELLEAYKKRGQRREEY